MKSTEKGALMLPFPLLTVLHEMKTPILGIISGIIVTSESQPYRNKQIFRGLRKNKFQ